jgi:hypothetical protein
MNRVKSICSRLTLVPVAALAAAGAAHAEVPTDVTTALATMKDDALVVAGLVLVAIIAVAAFKFMRKGF